MSNFWYWDKKDIIDNQSYCLIQTEKVSAPFLKDEIIEKNVMGWVYYKDGRLGEIILKTVKNSFDMKYLFKLLGINKIRDKIES